MSEIEGKSEGRRIGRDHQLSPTPPWYRRRWLLWTGLLLLLILAVVIFVVIHKNDAKAAAAKRALAAQKQSVTATVATATKGSIGIYLDAIGTVTPVYTASILAQASGVLTAVHYSEGQFVQKGDALIDIDPRPYQAQLLQAEGALERDTNVLSQAQMDLDRYRTAWAGNGINKQLLDDQEKIVLQDQGTVKNDQGTVNYDQVQLGYCHITAPIAGKVGLRLVDPGNVVQANGTTVLVVITQVQPTTVIFTMAEDSLAQVQARMRKQHTLPVEAWDRAQTTKIASGKLFTIDNQIDTTTGTVKLRALFDNKNGVLFPNQFVNARLLVDTLQNVTLLPNTAIQRNADSAFVYTLSSPTNASPTNADSAAVPAGTNQPPVVKIVNMQTITVGTTDGNVSEVEGIDPGTPVAADNFNKLADGEKVIVRPSAETTNAPARTGKHKHKSQAAQ